MRSLEVPRGCVWELIVVNNGAGSATDCVVSPFRNALPLNLIHEPTLGLSVARNTGVRASSGELIVFTDDDVIVDSLWLTTYFAAPTLFPHCDFFGGMIVPQFSNSSKKSSLWENSFFDGYLLRKNLGPDPREIVPTENFFGANMAFKRSVFSQLRFAEYLGIKGSKRLAGEETDLIQRCLKQGFLGAWLPQARVLHPVSRERLSPSFFIRYFWGLGVSTSLQGQTPESCEMGLRGLRGGGPFGLKISPYSLRLFFLSRALDLLDWRIT